MAENILRSRMRPRTRRRRTFKRPLSSALRYLTTKTDVAVASPVVLPAETSSLNLPSGTQSRTDVIDRLCSFSFVFSVFRFAVGKSRHLGKCIHVRPSSYGSRRSFSAKSIVFWFFLLYDVWKCVARKHNVVRPIWTVAFTDKTCLFCVCFVLSGFAAVGFINSVTNTT